MVSDISCLSPRGFPPLAHVLPLLPDAGNATLAPGDPGTPSLVLEEPCWKAVGGLPKNEPGDPEEFFGGFGGGTKLRLYISRVNSVVKTE